MWPAPRRARLGAVIAAASACLAAAASPAYATFAGASGRISFASDRGGSLQIYTARPDGGGLLRLTHTSGHASSFSSDWSPDGRWIVFDSDRTGNVELFLMRPDGSGLRQLTHSLGFDADPAWLADGRWVAYSHGPENGAPGDLWLVNVFTGETRRVTHTPHVGEIFPAASPRGTWLTFTRIAETEPLRPTLMLIRADGSGRHPLTPAWLHAGVSGWHPSGNRIVFQSNVDRPHSVLYSIRPDGTGLTQLTHGPPRTNDLYPDYSPDGRWIVFASDRVSTDRRPNLDLWKVRAGGGPLHRITLTRDAFEVAPDWGTAPGG
jgi:Tol biopolymer transport system component